MPVDFKYCASDSFAFRQLHEKCHFRSGFPQFHTLPNQPLTFYTALSGPGTKITAWYVACGTPFLRQAESCYQTLGSVLLMSSCFNGETLATPRQYKCLRQGIVRGHFSPEQHEGVTFTSAVRYVVPCVD